MSIRRFYARGLQSARRAGILALLMGAGSLFGCHAPPARSQARVEPLSVQFKDVTQAAGITFVHHNGATGKRYYPETMGSGCAFLDYDNDGWDDILLIDSKSFAGDAPVLTLYHNNHDGTFTDVTRKAGLSACGYGMGCAIGDYDNDGFEDIFVSCIGPNHLYHNNGNGTFTDVTASAGVATSSVLGTTPDARWKWSSSCAFVDYDNDGKLDLFVSNYLRWSPQDDVTCAAPDMHKIYCGPERYRGVPNLLYRNLGHGKFEDVSKSSGIAAAIGKGLGVAPFDYNGDGWVDFAGTNDRTANFLFINHKGKSFTEEALGAGVAMSDNGKAKAGMGVDVADWQNNGHVSMLVGNWMDEKLSLLTDDGAGHFTDRADAAGMGQASITFVMFGVFFFDFDLDGWQDAFVVNGQTEPDVPDTRFGSTYAERPMLFHNAGGQRFEEVGRLAGAPFVDKYVLRGCAYGDIDNDGFPDILVVPNNNQPVHLWKNTGGNGNHWVRFTLRGVKSNRSGIGAMVTLKAGGMTQHQWVKGGSSYMSQCTHRITFGLGKTTTVDSAEVHWPSGVVDRVASPPLDRAVVIEEGKGIVGSTTRVASRSP